MDPKERMNIKMGSEERAAGKESFYEEGKNIFVGILFKLFFPLKEI